ncbi:TetR/AcrR family transcriptional regulator [Daejeonella oryzae]|uniref:TetR/AcrR family transcriptional regulator n=1 Tax=Daejeonella oryzae TaxID=1122943 RepID=UPI0003F715DE|nr:TetR family transcriptional regulator [Daejeonella oryzae]
MTDKQQHILKAALELFAQEGYHNTSTSKVAKMAGVSEALIFRHFENKEGLLAAVLNAGNEKATEIFAEVLLTDDPKSLIKKALELPYTFKESEYGYWRLVYSLKWQVNLYNSNKAETLKLALKNAFRNLNYADPEAESELIMIFLDGAVTSLLLHKPENTKAILKVLLSKYHL